MSNLMIQDHMNQFPYVTGRDQMITDAMEYMRDLGIRHLPVVSDDKIVGIVSERDLKAALNLEQAPALTVGEVMKSDVYVVDRRTPLAEVAADMADGKIGSAVVIDSLGKVTGIFTTTDALRLLSERLDDENLEDYIEDSEDFREGLSALTGTFGS